MRISIVLLALAAGLLALPATAAAASCELTTAVSPGNKITITGSGFDPSATVAITTTWGGSNATNGGNGPTTTHDNVTSDASGAFTFTIPAGPGHGGTYDIEATAGSCTATTRVEALETAGGVNTGGSGGTSATPPATDTAPAGGRGSSGGLPALPIALLLGLVAGAAVLLVRRRADARHL